MGVISFSELRELNTYEFSMTGPIKKPSIYLQKKLRYFLKLPLAFKVFSDINGA